MPFHSGRGLPVLWSLRPPGWHHLCGSGHQHHLPVSDLWLQPVCATRWPPSTQLLCNNKRWNVKYFYCTEKKTCLDPTGLPHQFKRYSVKGWSCQCRYQWILPPSYLFGFLTVLPCNSNHLLCFQKRWQEGSNVENLAQESLQASSQYSE